MTHLAPQYISWKINTTPINPPAQKKKLLSWLVLVVLAM